MQKKLVGGLGEKSFLHKGQLAFDAEFRQEDSLDELYTKENFARELSEEFEEEPAAASTATYGLDDIDLEAIEKSLGLSEEMIDGLAISAEDQKLLEDANAAFEKPLSPEEAYDEYTEY